MKIKAYSGLTDQGPFLNLNEDGFKVNIATGLYMLVDGFGGPGVGDVATQSLLEEMDQFYQKVSGDPEATLPFYFSPQYLLEGNALINAVNYCHRNIYERNQSLEIDQRAGASVIFACEAENILNVLSIGNCAGFMKKTGIFSKIILEDSLSKVLGNHSSSTPNSCPANALGMFSQIDFKLNEFSIEEGTEFIFLTDGAFSRLQEKEIEEIFRDGSFNHTERIKNLFALSNNRGNLDNQTALVLQF